MAGGDGKANHDAPKMPHLYTNDSLPMMPWKTFFVDELFAVYLLPNHHINQSKTTQKHFP